MGIVTTNDQYYAEIARAIRSKSGAGTSYKPAEMAQAIAALSGDGDPEFEIPDPPQDGKTRFYISIPVNVMEGMPPSRADIPIHFGQSKSQGVSIDWGDGSPAETLEGEGSVNTVHHYTEAGEYTIALTPQEDCTLEFDGTGDSPAIGDWDKVVYCSMIRHIVFGSRIESIGAYAFYSIFGLRSVQFSEGILSIGEEAFAYCYHLARVILPESLTEMGSGAFTRCYTLKSVEFKSAFMNNIGEEAFSYCLSLETAILPGLVGTLSNGAFKNCYSLTRVQMPSVLYIGNEAFAECTNLSQIDLPQGLVEIYSNSFYWCVSLTDLVIPGSVKKLDRYILYQCVTLTRVTIQEGVEGINEYAFAYCVALPSIILPSSIRYLGYSAFGDCASLKEIHFLSQEPPILDGDPFNRMPEDYILYVPAGCAEAYKASESWAAYADHIQEEPTA